MVDYAILRVYTRERARFEGEDLASAIVAYVRSLHIGARCTVLRGVEGSFEGGQLSSSRIVDLSHDMPLVVDIVLPSAEVEALSARLEIMVSDGVVALLPAVVRSFRSPAGLLPKDLLVRDAMSAHPVVARLDYSARTITELMIDQELKSLPVVDAEGGLLGIVTQGDLVERAAMPIRVGLLRAIPAETRERWLTEAEGRSAAEVMTRSPTSIKEDQRLADAVHVMVHEGLKRLPVVDAGNRVRGMLSRIDLLSAIAATRSGRGLETEAPSAGIGARSVGDIAERDHFSLGPELGLDEAIAALARAGRQRAAVVDREGRLLGLISDDLLLAAMDDTGPASVLRALRRFLRGGRGGRRIEGFMLRDPVTVGNGSSLDEALALMIERGFKRLPVVDAEGRFLGMLRRDSLLLTLSRIV